MCCPCCMTSLCSRIFYNILPSPVISLVTMPSLVTDVTAWLIDPNPSCSKNRKIKKMKNKIKWKVKIRVKSIVNDLDTYRDYKRTQQGVLHVFLHYIYYYYKSYSKLHVLFISLLYYYHKTNILQLCLWHYCSSSFYYVPDLWHYIMWCIMWPCSCVSSLSKK